jgi:hypothetical protein
VHSVAIVNTIHVPKKSPRKSLQEDNQECMLVYDMLHC